MFAREPVVAEADDVDELLDRPGYAALWATKFSDILKPTQFDTKNGLDENASARRTYEWLRARLRENVPYDQMTERILLATSVEVGWSCAAWSCVAWVTASCVSPWPAVCAAMACA